MAAPGRVVVVGAGPNGLAAAVCLAEAGCGVDVIEAAGEPGGGLRGAELTLPGFLHDVCSSVHPLGAASPCFRRLRLLDAGLAWVEPPLALAHPLDDGDAVVLARDLDATARELGSDGAAYRRLMAPLLDGWDELLEDVLAPPFHLPRHPRRVARFARHAWRPAASLARGRFAGERARALFAGVAAHAVLPLERRGTAAFGLLLALAAHAVGWPFARGGSRSIADALVRRLRESGGELHCGVEVTALAEPPASDATLLDVTPRQLLRIGGDRLPRRYRRALGKFRHGPGTFKLDWALREPIPWRAAACRRAGTVHLGGSADEVARQVAGVFAGEHAAAPFVLVAQPSLFDASRAPAGRHTAWGYCHVPPGSTVDMTAAIESQVERFAPGFRDVVVARHRMDSAALEAHDANLVGGDIGGGLQDLRQIVARPVLRRDPYRTPVAGLFLCSASTPPGGGVHGMCGYHAARSALRWLGARR